MAPIRPINPRVIDLSHYDDVQDVFAGAVQFGIRGVINKVTEGYGGHDKSFDWRRKPCADAGLLYGAYHFLRPGRIAQQVGWFIDNVGDWAGILPALDHEDNDVPLSDARQFLELFQSKIGRWPLLYSGFLIKDQLQGGPDPFWSKIRLWLSHYSSRPTWPAAWDQPTLWQYSGDGLGPGPHGVPGIEPATQLDMNSFDGTDEELAAMWAA